jgi:hypothetical protein
MEIPHLEHLDRGAEHRCCPENVDRCIEAIAGPCVPEVVHLQRLDWDFVLFAECDDLGSFQQPSPLVTYARQAPRGPFAFAATKGVQLANFRPLRPVNKLMETFTKLGDTIFDPFLGGSGIEMTEWSSNEALAGRWAFLFFVARSSDHSKRNYCTK